MEKLFVVFISLMWICGCGDTPVNWNETAVSEDGAEDNGDVRTGASGGKVQPNSGSDDDDDDDDDDSGNNDDRTTKEQVEEDGLSAVCEKRTAKTMPLSISFASTEGQDCGVKGAVNSSKMTAYTKQDQTFRLPDDAVICEVEIATSEQTIYYDDEILLTLDGFFIAGANHTESVLKEFGMLEVGSLVRWSWDQHYGTKRDLDVGGCSQGINCEFPLTETNGRVVLKITDTWLERLPDDHLLKSEFELSVIATGNQNADTDCTHSGLELSGTVKYLE